VWQLPGSLLAENLLREQLVDKGVETLRKQLLNIGEFSPCKPQTSFFVSRMPL
jgi:hypothetical protein